ncbi:unnamed protein product, partial [Diamesa hyperborea]
MSRKGLQLAVSLLKNFSGDKDNLEEFIDCCNVADKLVEEDQRENLMEIIRTKLSGKAAKVIRNIKIESIIELRNILNENFSIKKELSSLMLEFNSLTQITNVINFSNKLESLLLDILEIVNKDKDVLTVKILTESYKMQALIIFLNGLKDPIQTLVKSRNPSTFKAAREHALSEETHSMQERGAHVKGLP